MIGRTSPSYPQSEAGFTLIEMLVALVLVSLSAGILAGSVRGARTVLAFIERNNAASAIVPAQNYLRHALAQTVPAQPGRGGDDRPPVLLGEPERIRFNTYYAPRGQLDGLYQVDVRLERTGERGDVFDLVAVQTLLRPGNSEGTDIPPPSRKSTLATNVRELSISFFGIDDDEPEHLQWLPSWSAVERLPRLVRIDVAFTQDQSRIWHRLEVPLHLSN